MIDKNQLKTQGLALGRSLQRAYKIALLYSAEHSAAEGPLQQTYASLNPLLKETRRFTLGFLNQRVLLNNILTSDNSLAPMEVEFSKRGIAAVCFSAGISFKEFRRGLGLLCTKPEAIVQNGGIKALLERNPIEGMQVLPAGKPGGKNEDTVLEMDAQSYLMAQAILPPQPGAGVPGLGLEMLLRPAGMERPPGFAGSAGEIFELATQAIQAAWVDPERNPGEAVLALTRLLEEVTPDYLTSLLPAAKQNELRGRSPQEVASELAEDMAVEWSMQRLSAAPEGAAGRAAEEEVIRVLTRAMRTTQMAQSFLQKLSQFFEAANLPAEVTDRIRNELMWFSLSPEEKHAQFLSLQRFNDQQFHHLVHYAEEMRNEEKFSAATEVAGHYFTVLEAAPPDTRIKELTRAPELLRALASLQTLEFLHTVAARLGRELLEPKQIDWHCHQSVANCLTGAVQVMALYEDFEAVRQIGMDLERSLATDRAQHAECCGKALEKLLTPAAMERLIELYLQKRDDRIWPRTVASLLKWAGAQGAETVFQRLEEETAAANRMRLIRLTEQLGSHSIEPTRKRLSDERWYVVRNACYVLGGLGDQDLPQQLTEALCHPDVRVQQAAVTSMIKSQAPGLGEMLAKALPSLQVHLQEIALDELIFRKDPATVGPLEQFILEGSSDKTLILEKVVLVLGAIPAKNAVTALGRILSDGSKAHAVRKAALLGLSRSPLPLAQQLLSEFDRIASGDKLGAECQNELQAAYWASRESAGV